MIEFQKLQMQASAGDKDAQLKLCCYYFEKNQHDELNKLFIPLLQQNYPPALLTKVDFFMRQNPDKGIGFLLELANANVPGANYKMAMLLFFHPELTLDFTVYLTQSCQLKEITGILATVSLFYQLGHEKQAQALLLQYKTNEQVVKLLNAMQIVASPELLATQIDYSLLQRPVSNKGKFEMVAKEINLLYIDNFVTPFDCAWLKIRAQAHLTPAYTVDGKTGEKRIDSARTNQTAQLLPEMSDWILLAIEQRISNLIRLPRTQGEVANVLYYQQHEEYKPHYDFFHPKDPGSQMALQDGGQRCKTALCILEACSEGGETGFPRLEKYITAKQGRLILFDNIDANAIPLAQSLHQGLAVTQGHKWVLTKWYRMQETSYKENLIKLNL